MREELPDLSAPDADAKLRGRLRISIPGYELVDIIGRGGQATVYKAVDLEGRKAVAIKVLHEGPFARDSARLRLQRESINLQALKHPNIVCFLKRGTAPSGHEYLVMNYIHGRMMDEVWETGVPCGREGLALFAKVCAAVGAAHRAGITHRDISPRNILVDEGGEPHILDFGLACSVFDSFLQPGEVVTVSGEFVGRFAYASPEQTRGGGEAVDIRTDVYSLGVVMYQMVMGGKFPYDVESGVAQTVRHIAETPPLKPSSSEVPIDPELERIVLKALEKEPARRYGSAGELGRAVEEYLARGGGKREAGAGLRRALVVAGVALVVMGGVVAAIAVKGRQQRSVEVAATGHALPQGGEAVQKIEQARVTEKGESPEVTWTSQAAVWAPGGHPVVDLFGMIDAKKDAQGDHRNWAFRDGLLLSENAGNDLEFPYVLPAEYDLKITFIAPRELPGQLMFFVPAAGKRIDWVVGEIGNQGSGIDKVDGLGSNQNITTHWVSQWIKPGEENTVVIHVRKDSTACFVNEVCVSEYHTDFHEIGLVDWFPFNYVGTPGVMFNMSGIRIKSAEAVEITGEGHAAAAADHVRQG